MDILNYNIRKASDNVLPTFIKLSPKTIPEIQAQLSFFRRRNLEHTHLGKLNASIRKIVDLIMHDVSLIIQARKCSFGF